MTMKKTKPKGQKPYAGLPGRGKKVTGCREAPRSFMWSQKCSGGSYAHQHTANTVSNILCCDCIGHMSVCICQNPVRFVILWVLYKSIAFPGSWLKHCAPLLELEVEGWRGPRRPSFYLSYWQLLAPGIWESSWSLWSNPQRGEERNGSMLMSETSWVPVWEGCQESSFLRVAPSWRTVMSSRRRNSIPTACPRSQGWEAIWDTKAP